MKGGNMHNKQYFVMISFVVLILVQGYAFGIEKEYGMFTRNNVAVREMPTDKSKILYRSKKSELAFFLGRTEKKDNGNRDCWNKIRTQYNRLGWVNCTSFKKFNKGDGIDNYYLFLIKDQIIDSGKMVITTYPYKNNTVVYNVTHEFLVKDKYIVFKYEAFDRSEPYSKFPNMIIYEIKQDKKLKIAVNNLLPDWKISIINQFFIISTGFGVRSYDSTKYYIGRGARSIQNGYQRIDQVHLRSITKGHYNDSYVEFDNNNRMAIAHIRDNKNEPMRIIKYKFQNGKFIKLE